MMSGTAYFRLALWGPLALALAVSVGVLAAGLAEGTTSASLGQRVRDDLGFVLSYGPAYAIFAAVLSRRLRGRSTRDALRLLWRAPAVFALLFAAVGTLVVLATSRGPNWTAYLVGVAFFLLGALVWGYACAVLIWLGFVVLRAAGVVAREAE